jgi:hypothetical protein
MRALALLVALAGCGRLGFGGGNADGAIGDGVLGDGDGAGGDAAQVCSPAFDICDGFESGINTGLWSADAMVTLDTTRGHRGNNSVRVHTPAFAAGSNSYQSLFQSQTIMTSTTFWIRAWFWLSALPATGNGMELITAERPGSNGDYVFIFADSTHIYTQFGNDSSMTTSPAPVGGWFCVVWKVVRSSTTTGSLDLTGDLGTLSLPNVVTDSATMPMTVLTIGMGFAASNVPSAQPALDLWIDDVIAHSGPVTCAD